MKEFVIKTAAKVIAGVTSRQFEMLVDWVIEASNDPNFVTGIEQALRVCAQYNANFAQQANWVVRTVVQMAYFVAKLRGEDT